MIIAAIIVNMIFMVAVFISFIVGGAYDEPLSWLILSAIFSVPIFNIVAFVISRRGGKSFIGLWFARKALEEKKKIEKLQSQKTSEQ